MKKILVMVGVIIVLSISSVAYAAKNETGSQGVAAQQNQNQVETQNQGEESQLNVNTQGDFGGQLDGTIQINRQTPQLSQLNLKLSGQFAPELESRLGLVATLIQGYRDPAGHIGLSIEGPLQMPQVRKL